MSGFYRKIVEEADRISNNSKNLFEQASGVEENNEDFYNYRLVVAGKIVAKGSERAMMLRAKKHGGLSKGGVEILKPGEKLKKEEVEQVDEKFKRYKDEAPSAEDVANVKKDFADMVKVFKKKIAKMERTEAKLKEKLRTAKTPKIKANLEDRLYTETHSIKWHKEWLRDAEAKAKKGDYDSIESAVDDLSAFAWD